MDAEQSDAAASRCGVRGGVLVWPRSVGQPYGRGTDRGGDSAGCVGRSSRPQEKNGHSGGRAAGHSGWGANAMLRTWWGQALVASRWSRGLYAAMKCLCFCYLGLEQALTRGPVALVGELAADANATIRMGGHVLTWMTAAFCLLRGLPVLVEGWKYIAGNVRPGRRAKSASQEAT